MYKQTVIATVFLRKFTNCFNKAQTFIITNCSTNFNDEYVARLTEFFKAILYLICNIVV